MRNMLSVTTLSPQTHTGVHSWGMCRHIQAHPWESHGVTEVGKHLQGHRVQPLTKTFRKPLQTTPYPHVN